MSLSEVGKKLINIPRPFIAILTFIIIIGSIIFPPQIPVLVTEETRSFVDFINNLPPGAVVCFGFDSITTHWVKTYTAAVATLNILFTRPVRVIIWSTSSTAEALFPLLHSMLTIPETKTYGVDWVYYGFVSGGETALQQLATNLLLPKKDYYGTSLSDLPVMKDIKDWRNVSLLISNGGSGELPKSYVRQWSAPYKIPMALLQTPVNTLMNIPFRASGQINWLLWANEGGAELEAIQGYRGKGFDEMAVMNVVHLYVIFLVILGNIGEVLVKRGSKK
jgi:hypothetical protein